MRVWIALLMMMLIDNRPGLLTVTFLGNERRFLTWTDVSKCVRVGMRNAWEGEGARGNVYRRAKCLGKIPKVHSDYK